MVYSSIRNWQTVWVEAVSKNCIKDLLITPSLTGINLKVNTEASRYTVTIENNDFKKTYTAKDTDITIDNPHYWTPDDPYLYTFSIPLMMIILKVTLP